MLALGVELAPAAAALTQRDAELYLQGSFSAVSKRKFATKYAFFQVFRDLQNYLADFLKKLQIFCKILRNFRISEKKS